MYVAKDAAGTGVTVNSVIAGPTHTGGLEDFVYQLVDKSLPWDQEHPNTLLLLQLLALPYDQHPDYDPDWRPA